MGRPKAKGITGKAGARKATAPKRPAKVVEPLRAPSPADGQPLAHAHEAEWVAIKSLAPWAGNVHPRDDASSLWSRALFPMGIALLRRVVGDVSRGVIVAIPQSDKLATWEPSISGRPALRRPDLPMLCSDNAADTRPRRILDGGYG